MAIQTAQATFALCVGRASQFPRDPRPEIALSGRSNVGKSSLINTILGRKALARVSSAPGKTITINYYAVDTFYLVDLPGYGYAKRSQSSKASWSSLTEDFFLKNPSADALRLVLQLIDIRTGPTEDDIHMINFMLERNIPFTVVATKTDKLSKTQLNQALAELESTVFAGTDIHPIPFSSVTKEGKETLLRVMADALVREKA